MENNSVKAFIEDAIKGGWNLYSDMLSHSVRVTEHNYETVALGSILLDPLAWQAVGKTRGWDKHEGHRCRKYRDGELCMFGTEGLLKNLQFICHLADGKTIEEALISLEK